MKTLSLFIAMALFPATTRKPVDDSIVTGPLRISPASKDLIIEFETGGRSGYDPHPEWPGGASGVTVGIGYDCGYNSAAGVRSDWAGIPESHRTALAATAGIKGAAAKPRAQALRWISIPWETSEALFVTNTMPRFAKLTDGAFPGVTAANPAVQGVMLSIVFNRGSSLSGSSRREMANCRTHLGAKPPAVPKVPAEIRGMKRLWVGKGLPGLLRRRDAEAALIESSLR